LPVQSEKLEQRLRGRVQRLLGEIMPAVEGKAAHVDRPFAPGRERTPGLGRDAGGGAPDREQRTSDFLARRARLLVVGEIGGAAGAIVLGAGSARNTQCQARVARRASMRCHMAQVGTMSSTASRSSRPGWSSASR